MNKLITLKNLYKIYKSGSDEHSIETVALKDIDLEILEDDFLAVMGPSGSGKSTLLNILGGLDKSSAGDVIFHMPDGDRNLSKMDESQLDEFRHNKIGIIFQSDNLLYHLTALENVELPLKFLSNGDSKEIATNILERIGLADRLHHKPSELSGGEKQRVALATAIAYKPMIILADEPTGELDHENVKMVMEIFREVHQREKIVFFLVTHNASVAKYANRYFSLYDGKLTEQSNLNSFENIHASTGDYQIVVDKLSRITIPQEILVEIQISDGIVSYSYDNDKIKISSYDESKLFAQIDNQNRILFDNELKSKLKSNSYRVKYEAETDEIIIFLKEVSK